MTVLSKVQTFLNTFHGRRDVVPRYWQSKAALKGFSPICHNEWKEGVCKKPCRTCPNAQYIPLSESLILDHFKGKHILGVYPLLQGNTLNFIACDLDNHNGDRDPLKDLRALAEVCQVSEIPLYGLRSKSGKGYHAYLFFVHPVPAWKTRIVYFALLREAQVIGEDLELSSFDKLIPDQDNLDGKKFGNLIALPFQGNAAKQDHTLFLDPATGFTKPYSDQWGVLQTLVRWNEAALDTIVKDWKLTCTDARKAGNGNFNPPGWVVEAFQGVAEGIRDKTGSKLAGYFIDKRIPADIIGAILQLWNQRNRPPLGEDEIEKIILSVSRYETNGVQRNAQQCAAIHFVRRETEDGTMAQAQG
jgi:hypothetical protein